MRILSLLMFAVMSVACSNQWRDTSGVDSERMLAALGEITSSSSASGDLQTVLAMKDQPGVRIYYAESSSPDSPMGPVPTIVSLSNFDFLGQSGASYRSFEEARVFFFDLPSESGHQNGLIVGLRKAGESGLTYSAFSGTGSFGSTDMSVTLQSGGADKLVLRSYDVTGGDLDNVIQLLVWDIDGGAEFYNGKFPTLLGFGD